MAKKPTYEELERRVKELEEGAKRKRAEDELRDIEARLHAIYEYSPPCHTRMHPQWPNIVPSTR